MNFDFIPTGGNPAGIQTGHCICKKCGVRVETGIINLSQHWAKCSEDEFIETYVSAVTQTAKSRKQLIESLDLLTKMLEK